MRDFEQMVASYIFEHGSITESQYNMLQSLYMTEISARTRRMAEHKRNETLVGIENSILTFDGDINRSRQRGEAFDKRLRSAALRFSGDVFEIMRMIKTFKRDDIFGEVLKELEEVRHAPMGDWKEIGTMGMNRASTVNKLVRRAFDNDSRNDKHNAKYNSPIWRGLDYANLLEKAQGHINSAFEKLHNDDNYKENDKSADMENLIKKRIAFMISLERNRSLYDKHSFYYNDSYESTPETELKDSPKKKKVSLNKPETEKERGRRLKEMEERDRRDAELKKKLKELKEEEEKRKMKGPVSLAKPELSDEEKKRSAIKSAKNDAVKKSKGKAISLTKPGKSVPADLSLTKQSEAS